MNGSSWVKPGLSKDKYALLKDHNAVTLVRYEPVAPQSQVKHSTTDSLSIRFSYLEAWMNINILFI